MLTRLSVVGLLVSICTMPLIAGPIVNVALQTNGGVASQSSLYASIYPASNAIDGSLSDFSHTNPDFDAWWRVDFSQTYYITDATVYNRTDCCFDRLSPFNVLLLDSGNNIVWSSLHLNLSPSGPDSVTLNGINTFGSALMVQLDNHANYLHLAEVVANADLGVSFAPEPATWLLLGSAIGALAWRRRLSR